jgi:hypothetical protein
MRIRTWLLWVAAAGCGGGNGGGGDAGADGSVQCTGPCCGGTNPDTHSVTPDVACGILGQPGLGASSPCVTVCGGGKSCSLPTSYEQQFTALNADAGLAADGGRDVVCPNVTGDLTVTCYQMCTGRRTAGFAEAGGATPRSEGERLAVMARLEAISVHAFDRLGRELTAHAAPSSLARDAGRARRDEVRHTAMTARLARRRGSTARLPDAPSPGPVRSLFEIALENAVEGCVRETYGAVTGLIEARTSRDRELRRAMGSIAADECRHAELAWAVHAWALPRLSSAERERVEVAMREAIAQVEAADPRVASLLFRGPALATSGVARRGG